MIRESIRIRNVGALKDTLLLELKPMTVLIGASACGKSTLMNVSLTFNCIINP